MSLEVRPIGIIRTQFKTSHGVPIQSCKSNAAGLVEVYEEYVKGLDSLDEFSHIILLYWFHNTKPPRMEVKPYLDSKIHGLFSTRAPARPNPIGLSIVELNEINGSVIKFIGADMLDKTPLIDIKPFIPEFDNRIDATSGWLTTKIMEGQDYQADDRFEN